MSKLLMAGVNVEGVVRRTLTKEEGKRGKKGRGEED